MGLRHAFSAPGIPLEEFAEVVTSGNQLVIDIRDPEVVALERLEAERYVNIPLSDIGKLWQVMRLPLYCSIAILRGNHDLLCRPGIYLVSSDPTK